MPLEFRLGGGREGRFVYFRMVALFRRPLLWARGRRAQGTSGRARVGGFFPWLAGGGVERRAIPPSLFS